MFHADHLDLLDNPKSYQRNARLFAESLWPSALKSVSGDWDQTAMRDSTLSLRLSKVVRLEDFSAFLDNVEPLHIKVLQRVDGPRRPANLDKVHFLRVA